MENAGLAPIITIPAGFVPPPMPPEIAKAVVKVMAGVNKLAKDGTNTQGGYAYTSVDAFFEMIRPLMAEAAIFDMLFEISSKTVSRVGNYDKKSNWLECEFDIYFYHESGVCFGPIRRNIQVIASGPQANASAQSFVEKAILRSLFKIATGDVDPDQHPLAELPIKDERPPRDVNEDRTQNRDARDNETRRKLAVSDYLSDAIAALKAVTTTQFELRAWWANEKPSMEEYFSGKDDPAYAALLAAFKAHGATLPVGKPPKDMADDKAGLSEEEFARIAKWAAADLASCLDAGAVAVTMESFRDAAKMSSGQLAHLDSLRDEWLAEFKAKK